MGSLGAAWRFAKRGGCSLERPALSARVVITSRQRGLSRNAGGTLLWVHVSPWDRAQLGSGFSRPDADRIRMKDLQAFPPSAAASLVSGYCTDFIELASNMAQTLEQVTMRGLDIGNSTEELARVERGMRALADAIHDAIGKVGPTKAASQAATQRAPVTVAPRNPIAAPTAAAPRPVANAAPAVSKPQPALSSHAVTTAGTTTLQGNSDTLPMRSVFQFLSRTRKNGMLHVAIDMEKVRFQFVDGCLVGTSSTQSPSTESLGNVLAELGFVDANEVAPIVKQHGDGRQRLGSVLLQMGRITHEQLAQAVELQTSRRFHRIVEARHVSYEFHAESDHGDGGMRIRSAAPQSGNPKR